MILRHSLFEADVAEYRVLLIVCSAHNYFLNQLSVEKKYLPWDFFRKL